MEKKDMIPVGTKVSPEARDTAKIIFEMLRFSEYDYLQMCYDWLVRMKDIEHPIPYEWEQMIVQMDGFKDWRNSIRLTDSLDKMQIHSAIYFLQEPGRKGVRALLVQGQAGTLHRTVSFNTTEMLEVFLELVFPTLYRLLRILAADMETNTAYDTLYRVMSDMQVTDIVAKEVVDMFTDDDWERGHKMSDQQRTKQTRMTQTQKEIEWS